MMPKPEIPATVLDANLRQALGLSQDDATALRKIAEYRMELTLSLCWEVTQLRQQLLKEKAKSGDLQVFLMNHITQAKRVLAGESNP